MPGDEEAGEDEEEVDAEACRSCTPVTTAPSKRVRRRPSPYEVQQRAPERWRARGPRRGRAGDRGGGSLQPKGVRLTCTAQDVPASLDDEAALRHTLLAEPPGSAVSDGCMASCARWGRVTRSRCSALADPSEVRELRPRDTRVLPWRGEGERDRGGTPAGGRETRPPGCHHGVAVELRVGCVPGGCAAERARRDPFARSFDVVQFEFAQMAVYRTSRARNRPLVVLDEHNIEFDVVRRTADAEVGALSRLQRGQLAQAASRRARRLARLRRLRRHLRPGSRDARSDQPGVRSCVVPNGVDVDEFAPDSSARCGHRAVLRRHRLLPEHRRGALLPARGVAHPGRRRPGVRLQVVGPDPPAVIASWPDPAVTVTGYVDDVRVPIGAATVVVAPLRIGGGTRLKVVEAMGLGKALVSTTLGAEGIDVTHDRDVLIADTPADFAQQVLRVLGDAALARRLGAEARRLVVQRYSWRAAGERLVGFYRELGASGLTRRTGRGAILGGTSGPSRGNASRAGEARARADRAIRARSERSTPEPSRRRPPGSRASLRSRATPPAPEPVSTGESRAPASAHRARRVSGRGHDGARRRGALAAAAGTPARSTLGDSVTTSSPGLSADSWAAARDAIPSPPPRSRTRQCREAARLTSGPTRSEPDTFSGTACCKRREAQTTGMPSASERLTAS